MKNFTLITILVLIYSTFAMAQVDCEADPFNSACGFNSQKAKTTQVLCNDGSIVDVNGSGNIIVTDTQGVETDTGVAAKNKYGKFKDLSTQCSSGASAFVESGVISIPTLNGLTNDFEGSNNASVVDSGNTAPTISISNLGDGSWDLPPIPITVDFIDSTGIGSQGILSSGVGSS